MRPGFVYHLIVCLMQPLQSSACVSIVVVVAVNDLRQVHSPFLHQLSIAMWLTARLDELKRTAITIVRPCHRSQCCCQHLGSPIRRHIIVINPLANCSWHAFRIACSLISSRSLSTVVILVAVPSRSLCRQWAQAVAATKEWQRACTSNRRQRWTSRGGRSASAAGLAWRCSRGQPWLACGGRSSGGWSLS